MHPTANNEPNEVLSQLKRIFGEYYIVTKITSIQKDSPGIRDEELIEKLTQNLLPLSPFVVQELQGVKPVEVQYDSSHMSGSIPDDVEHLRHVSLPSHTSDLLEGTSGNPISEHVIHINPNF